MLKRAISAIITIAFLITQAGLGIAAPSNLREMAMVERGPGEAGAVGLATDLAGPAAAAGANGLAAGAGEVTARAEGASNAIGKENLPEALDPFVEGNVDDVELSIKVHSASTDISRELYLRVSYKESGLLAGPRIIMKWGDREPVRVDFIPFNLYSPRGQELNGIRGKERRGLMRDAVVKAVDVMQEEGLNFDLAVAVLKGMREGGESYSAELTDGYISDTTLALMRQTSDKIRDGDSVLIRVRNADGNQYYIKRRQIGAAEFMLVKPSISATDLRMGNFRVIYDDVAEIYGSSEVMQRLEDLFNTLELELRSLPDYLPEAEPLIQLLESQFRPLSIDRMFNMYIDEAIALLRSNATPLEVKKRLLKQFADMTTEWPSMAEVINRAMPMLFLTQQFAAVAVAGAAAGEAAKANVAGQVDATAVMRSAVLNNPKIFAQRNNVVAAAFQEAVDAVIAQRDAALLAAAARYRPYQADMAKAAAQGEAAAKTATKPLLIVTDNMEDARREMTQIVSENAEEFVGRVINYADVSLASMDQIKVLLTQVNKEEQIVILRIANPDILNSIMANLGSIRYDNVSNLEGKILADKIREICA